MRNKALIIAALALVLGVSQCKKQENSVMNGEKRTVTLNAKFDNGSSKIAEDGEGGFRWTAGDQITVKQGDEELGTLNCIDVEDGAFKGEITETTGDVTFIFRRANFKEDYMNQTGALNDAISLTSGEVAYEADGNYDVTMTMPHAVLKLDLSAFGSTDGNKVGIKVDGTVVATVAGIKNVAKAVFVAVPADGIKKAYTISGNSKGNVKNWTLNANIFYTADDGSGQGTGDAITIEYDPKVVDLNNLDLAEGSFGNLPLWVKYNLGVNPEDLDTPEKWYGDYYAWGETEPYYSSKSPLTWKDGKSGGYCWQSYCGSSSFTEWDPLPYDESNVLKPNFDAARQHGLGDDWRLPTANEWEALRKNTFCVKTTNYNNISGLNGYIVYRVKDARDKDKLNTAPSGESYTTADTHIFLPFPGYYSNKSRINGAKKGYYWSSTLSSSPTNAFETYIWDGSFNLPGGTERYWGLSVHPVR